MTGGSSLNDDIEEIIITPEALAARVREIASEISADYSGKEILLVGVLKGAVMFMTDLARQITVPVELDFMATSSYGNSTNSSGVVRIIKDLDEPIEGKDVLVVEDIVDSGLTLRYLVGLLKKRNPASLNVCTLLDKGLTGAQGVETAYRGFLIPNQFVVGYGLDYAQKYRNLPYIGVLKPSVYTHEG